MGGSEAQGGCKKHLNPQVLPGVCSSCLRERLSQLSGSATAPPLCSSSHSSSPPYSSASSSIYVSSPVLINQRRRNSSEVMMGSMTSFIIRGSKGLRKSRSLALAASARPSSRDGTGSGKKKGGFWSKLIGQRRTKDVVFMHSRSTATVKERLHY